MTRIRFTVSYDGTDFCGWQMQKHGSRPSVQSVMTQSLRQLFNEEISLCASGRTDAGVHARAQVCHFDTKKPLEVIENWDLLWALKSVLPPSISVKKMWIAPQEFHSTLSATRKTYRYFIYNRPRRDPFFHRYSHWARKPIEMEHLNASARYLLGKQDFKSFQTSGSVVTHTERKIFSASWDRPKPHILRFSICGSGFLKQMVRNIVGTQLMLEAKKQDPAQIKAIIEAKDRRLAGPSAPPQGLFLWRVYYPKELDNKCREL